MRILISGAGGMLGTDLVERLSSRFEVIGVGRSPARHLTIPYQRIDLADEDQVVETLSQMKPDLVLHAAAMTDVDGCEADRQRAMRDNVLATQNLVKESNRRRWLLVYFSTDYVFDGKKKGEYTEEDPPAPINVYGETKFLGEKYMREIGNHFVIFRCSWLYGVHGKSFPRTVLQKAQETNCLQVVDDQKGRPTFTRDVADAFLNLLSKNPRVFDSLNRGTFHLANTGSCSWAQFAVEILKRARCENVRVEFVDSSKVARPARRPSNSILSLQKVQNQLGLSLRPWEVAIDDFIELMQAKV